MRLLLLCIVLIASAASAQELPDRPQLGRRQVIFLREGLDALFGNVIFAVDNKSGSEAAFTADVLLPREAVDFAPTDGIEPQDLRLDGERLVVERVFPAGLHIVGVGFKVAASGGISELNFRVGQDIESLSIMLPKSSSMQLAGGTLALSRDDDSPDDEYRPYSNTAPVLAGTNFSIQLNGLPEGRGRIWQLGVVVAALMLVLGTALALRTRPKIQDDGGEAFLLN